MYVYNKQTLMTKGHPSAFDTNQCACKLETRTATSTSSAERPVFLANRRVRTSCEGRGFQALSNKALTLTRPINQCQTRQWCCWGLLPVALRKKIAWSGPERIRKGQSQVWEIVSLCFLHICNSTSVLQTSSHA